MNKFNIYNIQGEVIAEGSPRYTSTFGQPDCVEFSTIASEKPIEFTVGCYVDYDTNGSGLGYPGRYELYTIPQVTKQARRGTCGDAFVYSNVQFFAPTKMLERKLFRDIVKYDNGIHFSTRGTISTYENVSGIAARIEACMNASIGSSPSLPWKITVVDYGDSDLRTLVETPKEFAVNAGATCLDVLNEIYKLWKGIGWVYTLDPDAHHIYLGKPNVQVDDNTTKPFLYGKGRGLKLIKRSISSAQEFATRIFAYGSTRNLISRYYNSKDIYNAESVDIPNLMLPVGYWGKTDGLHDARKAYSENADAIAKFGEVEKIVYFDGTGDYPEIFPSIEGVLFTDIRSGMSPSDEYYPSSTERYPDGSRVDEIRTGSSIGDNGLYMGSEDGSRVMESGDYDQWLIGRNYNYEMGRLVPFSEIVNTFDIGTVHGSGKLSLRTKGWSWRYVVSSLAAVTSLKGRIVVRVGDSIVIDDSFPVNLDNDGTYHINFSAYKEAFTGKYTSGGVINVKVGFEGYLTNEDSTTTFSYVAETVPVIPKCHWEASYSLTETFMIELKQIGFDISKQATTASNGIGTICMKDGKCGGREFAIKSCTYNEQRDSWELICYRQNDTDISQYFPNSDYQIADGDHYVLTDITMPPLYVAEAEYRLLVAADKLLADMSKPKYVYEPEIDPILQAKDKEYLSSGHYMPLIDEDIIGGDAEYVLIDSVVVAYNEYNIPTVRVTLKDEKTESFFQKTTRAQYKTNREVAGVKAQVSNQPVGVVTKADGGEIVMELSAAAIINALGYTPLKSADIPSKVGQLENDKGYINDREGIISALGYTPSEGEVCVAYYGNTSYQYIKSAYNAGKTIVCIEEMTTGNVYYVLYRWTKREGSAIAYFTFTANDGRAMSTAYVDEFSNWSKEKAPVPSSPYNMTFAFDSMEIRCDADGNIIRTQGLRDCQAKLWKGSNRVPDADIIWRMASDPIGLTGVSLSADGVLSFNASTLNFSGSSASITVIAETEDGDNTYTFSKDFTLIKRNAAKDGADGENGDDATVYWFVINPTEVFCDKANGYAPDVSRINVTVMKQTGNDLPIVATDCRVEYAFFDRVTHTAGGTITLVGSSVPLTAGRCRDNYKVSFRLIRNGTMTLTQDVLFLSDGIDSTAKGRAGAAVRGPVEWNDGKMGYRRFSSGDETDYEEDAKWIDIVRYQDEYYVCVESFQNYAGNTWEDVASHFVGSDARYEFVATKLLLATDAKINFLSGNEIYLMSGDNVTGGTRGASDVNDVVFWAGGDAPDGDDTPFKVHKDGSVDATKGKIGPWDITSEGISKETRNPSGQVTRQSMVTLDGVAFNYNNLQKFRAQVNDFTKPIVEIEVPSQNSSKTAISTKGDIVQDGNRVIDSIGGEIRHIEFVDMFPMDADPYTLYIKTE